VDHRATDFTLSNICETQILDFQLKHDSQGRIFYQNVAKYETKNHRGDDLMDEDTNSARIYEIPGKWSIYMHTV
jgi:hypothetical protein